MTQVRSLLLSMVLLLPSAVFAQALDCPSSASRTTEPFHFHIQMYRPDTRGFLDVWGINDYASQAACDRARETAMKRNLAVVDYFKTVRGENQYEPDRFGNCHADMSFDKANPRYLTDLQRVSQIRSAEDVRMRVRERLLGAGMTTDNEIFRDVEPAISVPPAVISGARFVPMPQSAVAQTAYAASDLKQTKAIDTAKPTMTSLDQPLVDPVPLEGAAAAAQMPPVAPAVAPQPAAAAAPPPAPPKAAEVVPAPQPAPPPAQPAATTTVAEQPAPAAATPAPAPPAAATTPEPAPAPAAAAAAPMDSAEDVADSFVAYETQRIQNVIKASSVIADEAVKSKIYDACMQRSQLLSNLRALIEVSGAKSRLAANARVARTEDERLAFVSKLFGDDIKSHWAPKDATDVILEPRPDVDDDVVNVLRDAANKYNEQQKRRALYILLARGQPTEDQQLWLTTIADTFLQ